MPSETALVVSRSGQRKALFDGNCLEDLDYWARTDLRRALRRLKLIEAVPRDPSGGVGKPEPLRGQLGGAWSRRIDQEHRLVYESAATGYVSWRPGTTDHYDSLGLKPRGLCACGEACSRHAAETGKEFPTPPYGEKRIPAPAMPGRRDTVPVFRPSPTG